jgi:XTP/dITP diphosphohydrolase
MDPRILIATNNEHKLHELEAMLSPLGYTVASPRELGVALHVEERGRTFAENAVLKAEAFRDAAGWTALADDSGLVVDALDGAPGVYSARYGGPHLTDAERCARLLRAMDGVPEERRTARFVAVLALASPGRPTVTFEGAVEGFIARQPRGHGGFGYDPIFVHPPTGATFAELSAEQKAAVSHRGRALSQLLTAFTSSSAAGILSQSGKWKGHESDC